MPKEETRKVHGGYVLVKAHPVDADLARLSEVAQRAAEELVARAEGLNNAKPVDLEQVIEEKSQESKTFKKTYAAARAETLKKRKGGKR